MIWGIIQLQDGRNEANFVRYVFLVCLSENYLPFLFAKHLKYFQFYFLFFADLKGRLHFHRRVSDQEGGDRF